MRSSRSFTVVLSLVFLAASVEIALGYDVKLDVPWISQVPPGNFDQTRNCGQASVYMIWGYYNGKSDDQLTSDEIVAIDDWLNTRFGDPVRSYNGNYTGGTRSDRLPTLAREKYGFADSTAHKDWTIPDLQRELSLGHPVIVNVWTYMTVGGDSVPHWMVLVGMNDSTVWVNDPGRSRAANGKNQPYPLEQFKLAWEDQGSAVVVIGSTPPTPPPTAGFTMSAQGQSRTDGSTLNPGVVVGEAVAVTLSANCLAGHLPVGCSFGERPIAHWSWTVSGVSTQPADLSTVTVNLGSGPHSVTLVVTDDQGLQSNTAQGTVLVGTIAGATIPTAADDAYTMNQSTTLTVLAPGLLVNDTIPTGLTPIVEFLPPFPPAGLTNLGAGGFRLDLTQNPTFIGTLTLHYVIHSASGDSNLATVTIDVQAPTITLFYDRGELSTSFGQPVVDSQGRVLAVRSIFGPSCGFGFCEMRLDSINSDGTLNWETPGLAGGDSIAAKALFLGANDRAFVLGRTDISALESDGQPSPGWPVQLAPVFNWTFTGIALDQTGTTVFSSLGVFGACFNVCDKVVTATNADGSLRWQNYYPQDGTTHGIIPGPGGRIFTIADAGRPTRTLIGLDPLTGAEVCSSPSRYYLAGGPQGVFTASENQVTVFDSNCQSSVVYTSAFANTQVHTYVEGWAIGIEFPILPDPRPARLFGVSSNGASWQNNDIVPSLGMSPVRTSFGSSAYIVGVDAQDNGRQKVFKIDVTSGQILQRISTEGLCTNCGVAVAPSGTIYINDLNSTKIYKVQ